MSAGEPSAPLETPIPVATSAAVEEGYFQTAPNVLLPHGLPTGEQTPPVASVLITTCSIAGVPMSDVMQVNVYLTLALFVVLLLVTFFPSISLFLPELLAGTS